MNITEAVKATMDEAKTGLAHNTWRTYHQSLELFKRYLQENEIDPDKTNARDLSPEEFIRFPGSVAQMTTDSGSTYTKKTVKVYISAVKYFFEWLTVQGEIAPSYNEAVRFSTAMRKAGKLNNDLFKRLPVKGHLEKMLEAVKNRDEVSPRKERDTALVLLLATSGCRNFEIAQLKVKDIDLKERQVLINGKGGKPRTAFFSQEAADALRLYWKERGFSGANDPAFARHDRGAGDRHQAITTATVRNVVQSVADIAGIDRDKFTPHFFRHAFAIKTLHETGNLALVQDLLGHANPMITRLYAQIYPEELKQAHRDIFD